MVAAADTGFLAKLYLVEPQSAQVRAIVAGIAPPLVLTDWHTLEMANCFQRAVFIGRITAAEAAQCWRDFSADIAAGLLKITPLDHVKVIESARLLSLRHTPAIGTRSLDLLHVAAALELGADTFLSFDDRQKRTAAAEGLNVLP